MRGAVAELDPGEWAGWDGLVVVAGGAGWDGTAMSGKSLAQELVRHAPILYVNPPRSVLRGNHRTSLRSGAPGVAVLDVVVVPGQSRPVLRDVARWWQRRRTSLAARALVGDGAVDATLVASLDHVSGKCGERLQVLWGTDDWRSGASLLNLSEAWLRTQERRQLARVDRVIAVSDVLADRWRAMGARVDVVMNGCNTRGLAGVDGATVPDAVRALPGPVAAVIGHLSDRLDLALLAAVADTGCSLLLVGPYDADDPGVAQLVARPNVLAVGRVPSDELPGYLRAVTVGLTPYVDSAFNRASFPLKTLEYLAAGCRVVSTDLPATRALDTELVTVATGPADFAAATLAALRTPLTRDEVVARRAFAATHSWENRAHTVARLLGLRGGRRHTAPEVQPVPSIDHT